VTKATAAILGVPLLGLAVAGALWASRTPEVKDLPVPAAPEATARPPTFVPRPAATAPAPTSEPDRAAPQVEQLASLFTTDHGPSAEVETVERALLAMGEGAARAVIDRLDRRGSDGRPLDSANARERLFHLLRRLPGAAVDDRLAKEARQSTEPSLRTMAIESLGQRGSDRAFEALGMVARSDSQQPARPLLGERPPGDPGTAVPDEATFTPRMQAMAALTETKDPRATAILADIVSGGPDESVRMEAARNLGQLREQPRALSALQRAATSDSAAIVRLAALHARVGAADRSLAPVLETIAQRDGDEGVRRLAQQVLASLGR
jgi:HEAT repeat protein